MWWLRKFLCAVSSGESGGETRSLGSCPNGMVASSCASAGMVGRGQKGGEGGGGTVRRRRATTEELPKRNACVVLWVSREGRRRGGGRERHF
eukprot:52332-Chlamydomonas_euryale.AAC.1